MNSPASCAVVNFFLSVMSVPVFCLFTTVRVFAAFSASVGWTASRTSLTSRVGNGSFNLILARVYRVGILLDLVGAHNHVVGDCGTGGVGSEL